MDNKVDKQSISDIEKTISEIEGIEAARIVANGQGIEEIHVLSSSPKNLKALARDIESALVARHGLAVDYRKISIAQVAPIEEEKFDPSRLKLKSISIETAGLNCRVGINLHYNDKDFEGVAQGSCSSSGRRRLIAEAALKALEKACPNVVFAIDGLSMVDFGSRSAVSVCLTVLKDGTESLFVGSALNEESRENESIVKAVLAAINRRFSTLN